MLNRSRALASVAGLAIVMGTAAPAFAETLQEAIALAYRTNPTLLAQRANQRALDENIVQARAGLRPTVSATGSTSYQWSRSQGGTVVQNGVAFPTPGGNQDFSSAQAGVSLNQKLYTGGRVSLGIAAAEAQIRAGREDLRDIEQQVLAGVIQAYADVIRDVEILRIRRENLAVLRRQLEESRARFEVGEITRTDVAQSEARLAQSEADLAQAQAQLSVSRAAYAAVIGQSPGDLAPMPQLPGVPTDFDQALDVGLAENPGVLAAEFNQRSAEAAVAQARAEYRPSVALSTSYGGSSNTLSSIDLGDQQRFTATASVSVPLFTGGLNASRVAAALERANAAQSRVEGEKRQVLQQVSSGFAQVISARASLEAGQESVRAARVAAEGVRQEAQVGLRTTLDVLNQELELRNAEVLLASARRDVYVAQANLLSAMGRLGGANLDPALESYDPAANYERVRDRGSLPWDGVVESLDRIAAPSVQPATDSPDAPIDTRLKEDVVRTAPGQ